MKSQKTNINKERLIKPTPQQMSTTYRNIINHGHSSVGRDPGTAYSWVFANGGTTKQLESVQIIYDCSLAQLISHLKGCRPLNADVLVPSGQLVSFTSDISGRMPESRLFKKIDSIKYQGDENNLNQRLNGEIG
jgi:hypothetical protein